MMTGKREFALELLYSQPGQCKLSCTSLHVSTLVTGLYVNTTLCGLETQCCATSAANLGS